MKLYIEQIADGIKTVVATKEDEQSARISFHNTCKNLWNDADTEQAKVRITDEQFGTFGNWEEDIDKTGDDPEEVTGKLFVMAVSNNNLMTNLITEWIPNKEGIKGAMVDYHGKCAMYLNAPDVIQANVRIANETLDVFNGKAEEIVHIQPEPEP
jgi:hypothetical protein